MLESWLTQECFWTGKDCQGTLDLLTVCIQHLSARQLYLLTSPVTPYLVQTPCGLLRQGDFCEMQNKSDQIMPLSLTCLLGSFHNTTTQCPYCAS